MAVNAAFLEVTLVYPALGSASSGTQISNDWVLDAWPFHGCNFTRCYGGNCWDRTKGLG